MPPNYTQLRRHYTAARQLLDAPPITWTDPSSAEEEDYCSPPLDQEPAAVLDEYFHEIEVERVEPGDGWRQIQALARLMPKRRVRQSSV